MPRKKSSDDDSTDNTSQSSTQASSQSQSNQQQNKKSGLLYMALIGIVVIIIIAIAYYALSGISLGSGQSSKQILSNVSTANLNQTQAQFINDLKKSENVSALKVSYYSSNATRYVKESSNLTIAINDNQTLYSYKLGNYNRTSLTDLTTYTNSNTGQNILKNVSAIYYYNTNTTIICFNDTTSSGGLVTNSSLSCGKGDQGQGFIEQTPFTAANVSSLSYLVYNNSVTYDGVKTIAGRSCDSFIISNATGANLASNYSVFNMCLDKQYGVPLYFNQTDVVGGVPNVFEFTATSVSANVTSADFVIPQAYLNAVQGSSII
jgi:hypothetical protein